MAVMREYWQMVLSNLKDSLSKSSYDAWFSQVNFVSVTNQGRKIVLEVPSKFNKNYLENKFKTQLQEAIQRYYPKVIHVDYKIDEKVPDQKPIQADIFPIQQEDLDTKINLDKFSKKINLKNTNLPSGNIHNLNPKYTFETFVETTSNQLAVNVAQAIIQKPGTLYNPVFVYSGVGLGKTHLLQAIGHKFLETTPNVKVKYATCEMFFNHFISSIQNKNSNSFQEYYRSVDVLLLDDIQFISGKEATQEAFFHAFNELHQNNKQIVITSDKHPKSLGSVEERLISRFEWGIVIDISKPEFEDRLSVLRRKNSKLGLPLSDEHLSQIASKVNTNFRDLEGVLNRIEARIKLLPNRPFEDFELNKILSGFSSLGSTVSVNIGYTPKSPEQVLEVTSQVFGVSKNDILGSSRMQNIALARQVAMYSCKEFLDLSFPAVGKIFKRDHTTVMHAWKKINENLSKENSKIATKIQHIKNQVSEV
jgi:chromosomal replication initiator protein